MGIVVNTSDAINNKASDQQRPRLLGQHPNYATRRDETFRFNLISTHLSLESLWNILCLIVTLYTILNEYFSRLFTVLYPGLPGHWRPSKDLSITHCSAVSKTELLFSNVIFVSIFVIKSM